MVLVDESKGVSERRYERITSYVAEAAWAILPNYLATIVAIISERRSGHRPDASEIRARISAGRERRELAPPEPPPPSVAVIPIVGPIMPKAAALDDVSAPQGTSIEGLQKVFRAALADPAITAIVFDVDSPGGSVDLVPEMGAEILAARGQKPIVAVANTWAASAAYWLASAADELVVTPSGEVGSIGVYSAHQDLSVAMANAGIKTTLVSAGEYKVEGNPFEPLSREAEAEMQSKVDAYYAMFVDAVAAQRGVSTQVVEDSFGQGRMVMAPDAVARGMADREATLDQTIARLLEDATPSADFAVVRSREPDRRALATLLKDAERETRRSLEHITQRMTDDGQLEFSGYAAVYEVFYDVEDRRGEYREQVKRGAHTRTLRERDDTRLLVNHEGVPIARTKSHTLELSGDELGLAARALLDPRNPTVQELSSAMDRGDIDQMSRSMRVMRQDWSADYRERTIFEEKLWDVSIVTWPASLTTSAQLRSSDLIRQLAQIDPEELLVDVRAITPALRGAAERVGSLIERILARGEEGRLQPDPEPRRDEPITMTLEVARRNLELVKLGGR